MMPFFGHIAHLHFRAVQYTSSALVRLRFLELTDDIIFFGLFIHHWFSLPHVESGGWEGSILNWRGNWWDYGRRVDGLLGSQKV